MIARQQTFSVFSAKTTEIVTSRDDKARRSNNVILKNSTNELTNLSKRR